MIQEYWYNSHLHHKVIWDIHQYLNNNNDCKVNKSTNKNDRYLNKTFFIKAFTVKNCCYRVDTVTYFVYLAFKLLSHPNFYNYKLHFENVSFVWLKAVFI